MAEEIEMSFDSAASNWCKFAKTHLKSDHSFDSLCKVVQFLSDRCEHSHCNSAGACPCSKIAGLASGTTFVGTTGEGWTMTREPLTK